MVGVSPFSLSPRRQDQQGIPYLGEAVNGTWDAWENDLLNCLHLTVCGNRRIPILS